MPPDAPQPVEQPAAARSMGQRIRAARIALEGGASWRQAAEAAGVSVHVLRDWASTRPDSRLARALQASHEAGTQALVDASETCALMAQVDPRYQTALYRELARRLPAEYSERQRVDVSGGQPWTVNIVPAPEHIESRPARRLEQHEHDVIVEVAIEPRELVQVDRPPLPPAVTASAASIGVVRVPSLSPKPLESNLHGSPK